MFKLVYERFVILCICYSCCSYESSVFNCLICWLFCHFPLYCWNIRWLVSVMICRVVVVEVTCCRCQTFVFTSLNWQQTGHSYCHCCLSTTVFSCHLQGSGITTDQGISMTISFCLYHHKVLYKSLWDFGISNSRFQLYIAVEYITVWNSSVVRYKEIARHRTTRSLWLSVMLVSTEVYCLCLSRPLQWYMMCSVWLESR